MTKIQAQFGAIDIYLFDQMLRGRIAPGMRILDMGCVAASLAPALPASNFHREPIEATSFPDAFSDVVLSSAVLHFARDDVHFRAMLEGRRHLLPDGSQRYLLDEAMLVELTRELRGQLLDPLKTTVVQNQHSMTTWVLRKLA